MSQSPTVSVLVAVKDSQEYLQRCLESLAAQTLLDRVEVVVIDGGAGESDFLIVEKFRSVLPRVVYFRLAPSGVYSAWNAGIARAAGEFIMNLNSDDWLEPRAIELLSRVLQEEEEIALVHGRTLFGPMELDPRVPWTFGPHPMWRRSLHAEIGWFDESLAIAGDLDFWIRLTSKKKVRRIHELVGTFTRRPNSISMRDLKGKKKEILEVLKRHFHLDIPHQNFTTSLAP
jgi:O-antigen biosynthesis protein